MLTNKLLLIDDESAFLETIVKRLEKRGLKVAASTSGGAGIKMLDKDPKIDVVILDVKMPGMDGIETLTEIRRRFPLVEVIMLTGHATVETAIDGMKLGAFDYLMKPCDLDTLLSKVKAAAEKKGRHEEKIMEARIKEITETRAY